MGQTYCMVKMYRRKPLVGWCGKIAILWIPSGPHVKIGFQNSKIFQFYFRFDLWPLELLKHHYLLGKWEADVELFQLKSFKQTWACSFALQTQGKMFTVLTLTHNKSTRIWTLWITVHLFITTTTTTTENKLFNSTRD